MCGSRSAPSAPVAEESNGGLCSKWGISFICWVGSNAKDAAIWAVVNLVPGLEHVWNFFKGCGDGALEALGGVLEILTTIKDAATRPADFASEKLQQVQDLYNAATSDPEAFITEVLAGVADLEYRENHTDAEWVGKMACQYAIDILTGKASATLLLKVNKFLGRGTPGNGTPGNGGDNDGNDGDNDGDGGDNDGNDGEGCTGTQCTVCNSFPTGTQVRMGDGTHKPIEDIEPGDHVLAHDLNTGQWRPQLVLDQWSHLDNGHMATATIEDGSQITATDHHQFWNHTNQAWTELDQIQPGDHLLSPTGTIEVTTLNVAPATETLVWELTVATDHNFTVLAGETDLLVHNNICIDVDALSDAGRVPAKGGRTAAGRAYQKHMDRGELPTVPGRELDTTGQDLLDDILTDPGSRFVEVPSGNFVGGTRVIRPDGVAVTFNPAGGLEYFGIGY